jgi:hypothetical protein
MVTTRSGSCRPSWRPAEGAGDHTLTMQATAMATVVGAVSASASAHRASFQLQTVGVTRRSSTASAEVVSGIRAFPSSTGICVATKIEEQPWRSSSVTRRSRAWAKVREQRFRFYNGRRPHQVPDDRKPVEPYFAMQPMGKRRDHDPGCPPCQALRPGRDPAPPCGQPIRLRFISYHLRDSVQTTGPTATKTRPAFRFMAVAYRYTSRVIPGVGRTGSGISGIRPRDAGSRFPRTP